MTRLIFAPSLCQIINAAAALTEAERRGQKGDGEDTLVIFGAHLRPQHSAMVEAAARRVWPWKTIHWADDVLVAHFPTRRFAPVAAEVLHQRLGKNADEIWISKLCMDATKMVLYAYPRSRVILFEDGAEEYIPQEMLCGRARVAGLPAVRKPGGLRRELGHVGRRPECMELIGVCSRTLRRIEVFYSFLSHYLATPDYLAGLPVTEVAADSLRSRYTAVSEAFNMEARAQPGRGAGEPVVLFLPQPFATLFLTPEDEYELYRKTVAGILAKGYTIWWKEHPREWTPLAPQLQEVFGPDKIKTVPVTRQMPVECLVAGWDLAGVVSVSSTSLIYLHAIYGYPMYTAAGLIDPDKWLIYTDRELALMYARQVPGLENLPTARM